MTPAARIGLFMLAGMIILGVFIIKSRTFRLASAAIASK